MSPKGLTEIVSSWAPDGDKKRKFPGDPYFCCTHNTHNLASAAHLSLCFVAAGQTDLTCPPVSLTIRGQFSPTLPPDLNCERSASTRWWHCSLLLTNVSKFFSSLTLFKMSYERLVKPVWRSGLSSHLTKRVRNKNLKDFVVVRLIYSWLMSLMRILASSDCQWICTSSHSVRGLPAKLVGVF